MSEQTATRIVENLTIHGYTDFRTLCELTLTPETRYLVLDLDRTIHFGHNVGELLGWELSALEAYGEEYFKLREQRTDRKRFFIVGSRPLGVLRYFKLAGSRWILPGLFYLIAVKIASRFAWTRRLIYRMFGVEPVDAVQHVPRSVLLDQISNFPVETSRELTRGLWKRLEPDQAIQSEDIAWLHERFPNLRIVISSASPQPALEVAREALGVDDILYTAVEEHAGYLSTPVEMGSRRTDARRISPPSQTSHNASTRKIELLLQRYPDFCDPGTETVGMTDTGYGEDHSWAEHFKKVVDINSASPFAPLVTASSPLREIHSANVLTRDELARRAQGQPDYLDPRRKNKLLVARQYAAAELAAHLQGARQTIEDLAAMRRQHVEAVKKTRDELGARLTENIRDMEQWVHEYNQSLGEARKAAFRKVRLATRSIKALRKKVVRLERPVAEVNCTISVALEESRQALAEPARAVAPAKVKV
jgi:hypothetical protein